MATKRSLVGWLWSSSRWSRSTTQCWPLWHSQHPCRALLGRQLPSGLLPSGWWAGDPSPTGGKCQELSIPGDEPASWIGLLSQGTLLKVFASAHSWPCYSADLHCHPWSDNKLTPVWVRKWLKVCHLGSCCLSCIAFSDWQWLVRGCEMGYFILFFKCSHPNV